VPRRSGSPRTATHFWLDVDTVAEAMGYKQTAAGEGRGGRRYSIDDRALGALLTAELHIPSSDASAPMSVFAPTVRQRHSAHYVAHEAFAPAWPVNTTVTSAATASTATAAGSRRPPRPSGRSMATNSANAHPVTDHRSRRA
jgi:hypothetical protein